MRIQNLEQKVFVLRAIVVQIEKGCAAIVKAAGAPSIDLFPFKVTPLQKALHEVIEHSDHLADQSV